MIDSIKGSIKQTKPCTKARAAFVLLMALMLLNTKTFAQVERGRYTIGGSADLSLSYNWKNSNFNLALSPAFGVFVVKGFALGARYAFGVGSAKVYNAAKDEYTTTTTFTTQVGPSLKYYYGKKSLKGVAGFNANYNVVTRLRDKDVSNTEGFALSGTLGAAYFLNQHISLETAMYINASGAKGVLPTTRVGFSVGLFAFLDKKKQE